MSINTAHASGGVLLYSGEIILLYCDNVQLNLEHINPKALSGSRKGRIYLTSHRMIFLNKTLNDGLRSFSFPFFSLRQMKLKQPVFAANYIKGVVNAEKGRNWTGSATFRLKFSSGGAIEFGQAMLRASNMANKYMTSEPPPYSPYLGLYYLASPAAYMAPSGGVNGFVAPTHAFPEAPPANSVYTMSIPPPYPGICPPAYAYPANDSMNSQAEPPRNFGHSTAGPSPPGFNVPVMFPEAPPAGTYPPPYAAQPQGSAFGSTEQQSLTTRQSPAGETTASIPVQPHSTISGYARNL